MKRILITRPRSQASDFADRLRAAGFDAVFFPVIEIQPITNNVELDQALKNLNSYEWVVFTSVNGVDVVFDVITTFEKQSPFETWGLLRGAESATRSDIIPKIAAIGPRTAEALQVYGVIADFVPEEYVAESIVPGLGDLRNKTVLLPRAEIARKALPEAIVKAGGIAHDITVYKTLSVIPTPDDLAALKSGVDWITFTGPSTVQNFVETIRKEKMDPFHLAGDPKVACIGPITERVAREAGFEVDLVAEKYTTEGLVSALLNA